MEELRGGMEGFFNRLRLSKKFDEIFRERPRMGMRDVRPRGIMVALESDGPAVGKRTEKEAIDAVRDVAEHQAGQHLSGGGSPKAAVRVSGGRQRAGRVLAGDGGTQGYRSR